MVVKVAQLCEYMKNHYTVYFKRINFRVYELYPVKEKEKTWTVWTMIDVREAHSFILQMQVSRLL